MRCSYHNALDRVATPARLEKRPDRWSVSGRFPRFPRLFGGRNPGAAVQGLTLKDTATGEERQLAVRGLFYGIGHSPNSGLVAGQIDLDDAGYVKVCCCPCCG